MKIQVKNLVSIFNLEYNKNTKTFILYLDNVKMIDDINKFELNVCNHKTENKKLFKVNWAKNRHLNYVSNDGYTLITKWKK